MNRLKIWDEGFTLIELVIAIALAAVVLLSASNLLVSFGRFSTNVVRSESALMGSAVGVFEEIVGRITIANQVAIPAVDPANSRADIITAGGVVSYWLVAVAPPTNPATFNLMRT